MNKILSWNKRINNISIEGLEFVYSTFNNSLLPNLEHYLNLIRSFTLIKHVYRKLDLTWTKVFRFNRPKKLFKNNLKIVI